MPTYIPKADSFDRRWFVVDASGQVLGKVAVTVADLLSGKRKPIYTPFLDTGDHVVVINAEQIVLTGKKEEDKPYYHHSGYPGGIKTRKASDVRRDHPERIIEAAVKGMLPKTKLGRAMYHKLKVYAGPKHPHQAQKPEPLSL